MVFAKIAARFIPWAERLFTPDKVVQRQFTHFQELLRRDRACLKLITHLEEIAHRPGATDWSRVSLLVQALIVASERLIHCLQGMRPAAYDELVDSHRLISERLRELLPQPATPTGPLTLSLEEAWLSPELAGGKAASLSRIRSRTGIPVPPGFVITTSAFQTFLDDNQLPARIARHLRGLDLHRPESLGATAARLHQLILAQPVPERVRQAVAEAMAGIDEPPLGWAVRSSATGEDGEVSFAGQYASLLNVPGTELFAAYKEVLASKYSASALSYRLHCGLADEHLPMAVLVLPMVDARTSGVMYTLDPLDACQGECLVVTAVPGLGDQLVDGSTVPDLFLVSRQDPAHFWAKRPALAAATSPASLCLADAAATTLARWGLQLEALAGGAAQDVEWSEDQEGRLVVLQSRPIQGRVVGEQPSPAGSGREVGMEGAGGEEVGRDGSGREGNGREEVGRDSVAPPVAADADMLEMGTPASAGIASGPIYRLRGEAGLEEVPAGVILVTAGIPPSLVPLAHRVRAVLAEHGSKASHFASVAREFGLPLIVGLGAAAAGFSPGRIVTVDGWRGVVYAGEVAELLAWQERQKGRPASPFQRRLAPLMELISPLNLTDPRAADFAPGNCRTCHDLVRFIHEKGTGEMFSLVDARGRGLRRAKSLRSELPIVMQVLDLGEGLTAAAAKTAAVSPAQFASRPLQAVWAGLAAEDVSWRQGLVHLDWERFDRMSGGIFNPKESSQLASYALVAKNYAHLLLRFGYHFAVVDALSGDRPEENHIQFRFKGGGGMAEKKSWRLLMLDRVLGHFGFQVRIQEDMLEAKSMRLGFAASQFRLRLLGYLLARTPLLDMVLESEEDALAMAAELCREWQAKEGEAVGS